MALGRNSPNNIIDHFFNQATIITFRHNADQWLRPRWSNNQTSLNTKPFTRLVNCTFNMLILERLTPGYTHIFEQLRYRLKLMTKFTQRFVLLLSYRKYL